MLPDAEELIDSRIAVHDYNQFELKLDYAIDPATRSSRYQVALYFFVPKSLGIDSHSYRREQFYSDIQAYIRFKTPTVTLSALRDPKHKRSPITRAEMLLRNAERRPGAQPSKEPLSHELRLLGCLMRANMRDTVAELQRQIDRVAGRLAERSVLVDDVRALVERLLDDVQAVMSRYRKMRPLFFKPKLQAWVHELYEYTDEYMSLSIESYLTTLIARIDRDVSIRRTLSDTREAIKQRVLTEQSHRKGAGYVSVLDGEGGNGTFVYRHGALKKFMSSVLFLEISKQAEGRGVANIIAGIAAAVAMLFSTIAAIWSQSAYGINSFPFVIAVVIAYVFKDRIKEWLRTYFSYKLSRWLWDYNVTIRDPFNDIVVGRCRETFLYPSAVDPEIVRVRHADATSVLEPQSKPEIVMKYVKGISIKGKRIGNVHGRLHDINDIIRFNVSSFLVRMDDPIREVEAFDPSFDGVRTVPCPKTYHVNLVLVLEVGGEKVSTERFRVVLDKHGIRKLEQVKLAG